MAIQSDAKNECENLSNLISLYSIFKQIYMVFEVEKQKIEKTTTTKRTQHYAGHNCCSNNVAMFIIRITMQKAIRKLQPHLCNLI